MFNHNSNIVLSVEYTIVEKVHNKITRLHGRAQRDVYKNDEDLTSKELLVKNNSLFRRETSLVYHRLTLVKNRK